MKGDCETISRLMEEKVRLEQRSVMLDRLLFEVSRKFPCETPIANATGDDDAAPERWALLWGADANVRGWLPIETAPQNGTYVLVSNGRGVWVAKYKAVYQSGWKPDCPWQSMMLNHDHIPRAKQRGRPTHWMPLPEAPNAGVTGLAPRKAMKNDDAYCARSG